MKLIGSTEELKNITTLMGFVELIFIKNIPTR